MNALIQNLTNFSTQDQIIAVEKIISQLNEKLVKDNNLNHLSNSGINILKKMKNLSNFKIAKTLLQNAFENISLRWYESKCISVDGMQIQRIRLLDFDGDAHTFDFQSDGTHLSQI